MPTERTLAILKPDCVRKQLVGTVIERIEEAGFTIRALKMVQLTETQAEGFYTVHRERPFFDELVAFMTSGPCIPLVLAKENAVADFRALIGATDPADAEEGTVRSDFADSVEQNIVHGSDSVANGKKEVAFFFSESDLISLSG
jgi:nucleoside-diphosphate kinase